MVDDRTLAVVVVDSPTGPPLSGGDAPVQSAGVGSPRSTLELGAQRMQKKGDDGSETVFTIHLTRAYLEVARALSGPAEIAGMKSQLPSPMSRWCGRR